MTKMKHRILVALIAAIPLGTIPSPASACVVSPQLGTICYTAATYCPANYAEATGQVLPISNNPELYALYGKSFGGDGRTTFALPDLRGRVLMGTSNNVPVGHKNGQEFYKLTSNNLPPHSHEVNLPVTEASLGDLSIEAKVQVAKKETPISLEGTEGEIYIVAANSGRNGIYTTTQTGDSHMPVSDMWLAGYVTQGSVSGQTEENEFTVEGIPLHQPSLGLRACIAIRGAFPSRP